MTPAEPTPTDRPPMETPEARKPGPPPDPASGAAARMPPPRRAADPDADALFDMLQVRLLWNRRYTVMAVTLVFVGIGIFQANRTAPVYTSEALLRYEPASGQIIDFGERSTMIYQRDEIRTAVQLIKTPAVAEAVLDALGSGAAPAEEPAERSPLSVAREFITSTLRLLRSMIVGQHAAPEPSERLSRQNAARNLLNAVDVRQRPDTKLIEVRVSANTPQGAERLCREFCNQFIRSVNDQKRSSTSYARDYIAQQIEETKDRLEREEKALYDYGGQSDLRIVEESRSIAIRSLTNLEEQIQAVRNSIALMEAETSADVARTTARQRLAQDGSAPTIALYAKKNDLRLQIAELEADNTPEYPPLKSLRRQFAELDRQIAAAEEEYIDAAVKSRESELAAERRRLEALESRRAADKKALDELEARMIRFRVLQRDVESTRQILEALLNQFNRLEVTNDVAVSTVTVEAPASIPTVPSAPNVTRILGSFGIFGLLLGVGGILLLNRLDRSVRNPGSVEEGLGLPTLGFVPYLGPSQVGSFLRRQKSTRRYLPPYPKEFAAGASDAFRYLRTSIDYSSPGLGVVVVTSCNPSEGKSTVAANLAVFYAERGTRTLLIDADLKRPTVHDMFELSRMPGVSDVLAGKTPMQEAIRPSRFERLDVMPAGLAPPSSITLLESPEMAELLRSLRQSYGMIVIDSPPAHTVADALVLATRADGALIVVRPGHTPMPALVRVSERLRSIGVRTLGVVYNQAEASPVYGYHYGYGYGYGSYVSDAPSS